MKEKIKSPHPDWATSHRKPGTELRLYDAPLRNEESQDK